MKKAIRNLVLGAVMAASVIGTSAAAMAGYVQTGMNFRNGPSTTSTVIGSVPAGAQVDVIGSENGWDKVSYNGMVGYIHSGNIGDSYTASQAAGSYASTKAYFDNNFAQTAANMANITNYWKTVYVSDGYLALRSAPSYDAYNEIGQLYNGDSVEVICGTNCGSYIEVYSPKYDTCGYVNAGCIF